MKSQETTDISIKIFLTAIGFFGFLLIISITNKWGIGFSPDSVGYLAAARNIANGNGISLIYGPDGNPLTIWSSYRISEPFNLSPWPPFFPLVLSIFDLMKFNLFVAGRFLIAALFGVNIFLVTFIVKKFLKSTFLMVFAAIIMLTSSDMAYIHSMFWSEPLFIFLSLLGILFLINFLKNEKFYLLLIASLFFSLAFFTRTIGISLAAVSAVSVLLLSGLKIKNKIIYSAISIFIIILPFFTWTLINNLLYGRNTEFVYHPINPKNYYIILGPISLWVMPTQISEKIRVILISILIVAIISIASYMAFKIKKRNMQEHYRLNSKIIFIFLFFILFYIVALLTARYFFDAVISIRDNRILLPVSIITFIMFLFFLKRLLDFFSQKEYIKIIVYGFCGFLIATSFFNNHAIGITYNNGLWYSTKYWFQSETISELKKIPLEQNPIYTNDPAAIYLFLGRNPDNLPLKYNRHTGKGNSSYKEDLNKTMEEIKERDGLLVFFDGGWGVDFPNEQEIIEDYKLDLIKDTSDGAIYKINN